MTVPIHRKIFEVVFVHDKNKTNSCGIFQSAGFNNSFGKPVEKTIFERAVNNGRVFVTQVHDFQLKPFYLYHESVEELLEEYKAIKSNLLNEFIDKISPEVKNDY